MRVSLPAAGRLPTLRRSVLVLGVLVGAALAGVGLAWLLVANRAPFLERFALERNAIGAALIGLLLLVPVLRFAKSPGCIFLSGAVATLALSMAYCVAEGVFPRLGDRISAFHVFTLGAMIFGLLAALDWVGVMLLSVRQAPLE